MLLMSVSLGVTLFEGRSEGGKQLRGISSTSSFSTRGHTSQSHTVAGLSQRRPDFAPGSVRVGYVKDTVAQDSVVT